MKQPLGLQTKKLGVVSLGSLQSIERYVLSGTCY
jgi:hypothetical protein